METKQCSDFIELGIDLPVITDKELETANGEMMEWMKCFKESLETE